MHIFTVSDLSLTSLVSFCLSKSQNRKLILIHLVRPFYRSGGASLPSYRVAVKFSSRSLANEFPLFSSLVKRRIQAR